MLKLNDTIKLGGFVTKQSSIQQKTLSEIEGILGYYRGRLSQGAAILVAQTLPEIDDFYIQGTAEVPSHRIYDQLGNLNFPKNQKEANRYTKLKKATRSEWSTHGHNSLVKVIPNIEHITTLIPDLQYPPGGKVPQWEVNKNAQVEFRVIAIFTDKDYPNKTFNPK